MDLQEWSFIFKFQPTSGQLFMIDFIDSIGCLFIFSLGYRGHGMNKVLRTTLFIQSLFRFDFMSDFDENFNYYKQM